MSDSASRPGAPKGSASPVPARIGRYEILEKLGSGRTGTVYRATDPVIGRALAIKMFRVDCGPGPQRDRYLQRFYHEARISGGLAHPNIVALYDVGEIDGLPYLVFEHVEGPTLDVVLARSGRLDSSETIRVVEQTALALDFAHSKGIVHRDIRPANIILAADKRVRIAEFGIARIAGSQLTQHGEILGTPAYMSPEQIRGLELSASTDLFSLAVCAYEMLSGQRPFNGNSQPELLEALAYAPPAEPKALRSLGIPSREFMFVFERALAKEPSHRFGDAASFARALKSCLGMVADTGEALKPTPIAIPESLSPLLKADPPRGSGRPRAPRRAGRAASAPATDGGAVEDAAFARVDATLASIPSDQPEAATTTPIVSFPDHDEAETEQLPVLSPEPNQTPPGDGLELPPSTRMSRQVVEALLSKSSERANRVPQTSPAPPVLQKTLPGSGGAPGSKASEPEDLIPTTREMPRIESLPPAPRPRTPQGPPAGPVRSSLSPAVALHDAPPVPTQAIVTLAEAEKTVIMSESEKVAAAQPRRSESGAGRSPVGPPLAAGPPPSPARTPPVRTAPSPTPRPSPPSRSIAPRLLVGGMGLLTVLALALGIMLLGKSNGPAPTTSEMWNNLPVWPEGQVDKSPRLVSHENPNPTIEAGRVVSVTVSWIVTPEGLVDDPRIIISASPEIDAFVVERVRKWRYDPGEKDGKTVPVRVLRKYTFGQRDGSQGS